MTETSRPTETDQDDERRQHFRIDSTSTIRYQQLQKLTNQSDMKTGELCDFSGGGIRFLASESVPKNEQLVIELHFKGWHENGDDWVRTGNEEDVGQLNATGAVMWCSKKEHPAGTYEIGLRFTGRVRK